MRFFFLITGAAAIAPTWEKFSEWKQKYNVVFETPEEDLKRFEIYKSNLAKASKLTGLSKSGALFGASKFVHLTPAEFKKRLGYRKTQKKLFRQKKYDLSALTVSSVDWRDTSNAVTPVKDQGQCGSCWAFSAAQAIETGYWKSTGGQRILAPQQIVSCDDTDYGCEGGNTGPAYEYVEQAGGLERESDYPYVSGTSGMDGTCKANSSEFAVKVTNYHTVSQDASGERNMMEEIQSTPMSICVDAESWQLYMGGVVDSSTCGTSLDHCVMVVGIKAGQYWIVKNSWNTDWGEEGYIRVATDENACGVAEDASYVESQAESKSEVYV